MLVLLTSVATALCPHSAVLYDGATADEEVPSDHVRATACGDHPDLEAWNRALAEDCLYQARMRNGRPHLDEALREEGRCVANPLAASLLARPTSLKAGSHPISQLPFMLLRGRGLEISPWQPAFDHEDWPDVIVPTDNPSLEELLDLVYPEGWEIEASRHVNTRAHPIRTSLRELEQGPYWDDALRARLVGVYAQRQRGTIRSAEMVARLAKITAIVEVRAAQGAAPEDSSER